METNRHWTVEDGMVEAFSSTAVEGGSYDNFRPAVQMAAIYAAIRKYREVLR